MLTASRADEARAARVAIREDALVVYLTDGREIAAPLAWFPRLLHASTAERNDWRLVGRGPGIHWPSIDEDISVAALLSA
ncbi:MAG TPA: DUF2442 domain-containing protein [Candidatus Limnocylindrales bacterium]|nr:DUF2442 domain-containing protein [Candidatus Limnocylindrales bacterium]